MLKFQTNCTASISCFEDFFIAVTSVLCMIETILLSPKLSQANLLPL